jgi:ATP-dependent DNA helicase PIF1
MRTDRAEVEFTKWLLDIGNGTLDPIPNKPNHVSLPEQSIVHDQDVLIRHVFPPELLQSVHTHPEIYKRVILCPRNDATFEINDVIIKNMSGTAKVYYSIDDFEANNPNDKSIPVDYLHTLTVSGLPPHKLTLKIGAICTILRNLDLKGGLCNGTRVIILSLEDKVIKARILSGVAKDAGSSDSLHFIDIRG